VPRSLPTHDDDVADVHDFLVKRKKLKHLRVRRRADLVTIESGPADDPVRHARLRRVTVHFWTVECATHTGRWEKTGLRGPMSVVLECLVSEIPWVLEPVD
jgi:hypothetical protein